MRLAGLLLGAAALCLAQESALMTVPKVEVKGVIEKVQIAQGQGMPFIEVKSAEGTRRVILGSMRYLMEKNFNPKAGSSVIVKGYDFGATIVAARVELPGEKTEIQLRDEKGYPLWRMARYWKKRK
jgi:hypothetical protein